MGAMTKLTAVNRMLRGAGEYPVNTLEDTGVNDTDVAQDLLDETNMQVQMLGLNFNTEKFTYTPNSDGNIIISDNTLYVVGDEDDRFKQITQRGKNPTLLYDLTNNTDVWDEDVTVKITVLYPFEEVPTPIQFEITDLAARIYQMVSIGDTNMDAVLNQMAVISRVYGRGSDMRVRRPSMFRGRSLNARQATRRDWNYW